MTRVLIKNLRHFHGTKSSLIIRHDRSPSAGFASALEVIQRSLSALEAEGVVSS